MTIEEFYAALAEICPATESGAVEPPDGHLLAVPDARLDVEWYQHMVVEADYLGLRIDRLMGLAGGDEVALITGSESLDGVYYINHEIFFSVEEFEAEDELFDDYLDFVDREEFLALSADGKLELLEEELEFERIAPDLSDFLGMIRIVAYEDFYGD